MPITTTSFTSVNVGTSANDGTGDELRIAFQKVNSNFSNISTVGFNSGNILVSGNVQAVYFVGDGSQLTNIAASNAYGNANVAAYLVAYNGIVTASNVFVSGNVTSQWFLGKANVSSIITTDLGASGMIYANAGVNSTSTGTGALVVNGGVGITGNLTVGNVTVLGALTTVSSSALNIANSFVFLSNNNITNVLDIGFVGQYAAGQGNVYTGLVRRASDGIFRLFSNLNPVPSTTINVANITLATLQLGNILAGNVTGVINTPAQPFVTSLGNLANLSSSGNISTTGYFFGNGSQLAGIVSYSNVFVATYLPTYSGNIANLTVATTLAGPTITAINSNVSVGNTNMKNYVDGQITAANSAVTAANLGLKGYVDNSVSTANIGMKGYVDSVASLSIYGNSNVKSYLTQFDGNLISNGNIAYNIGTAVNQWAAVYANVVSAAYFTGNGALLTGIPAGYSNVQAATYLPTYSGNIANIRLGVTGTLTFADGTTMTTASAGGGSNYGNANVTAYTVTMGFTNYSNVNVSALITTNGLTNYSNVNAKAYAETMGYQNFSNVNVAAYVTSANSAIIGYIDQANTIQSAQIGAANLAITAANVGMKGYVDSVATLSSYGNSNVTAYTVSMGFTNFSNVNVSALITTNGLTNYSNVNTKAYSESMGYQNFGNVNVAALITTNGLTNYSNVNIAAYLGTGQITVANVKLAPSGNIQFADGTTQTSAYSNINLVANLRVSSVVVGNLTVLGALSSTLNIGNSFVSLSTDNVGNTSDIGFYGQYNAGQGNVYTGLAYTASDGMYRLFSNLTPEPSTTINTGSLRYSNIQVGNILAANVTVNTVIASNIYVNGGVSFSGIANVNMLNASGNLSVAGNTALYGNTTHGTVGAGSGAFHTFVGNITQVTSGGAVGINTTGNISASVANFNAGNVAGFAIGYRDVPQITAANVTLIASDAGKHYYGSNTNPVTLTIPLNSSVAFGNGTAISIINQGTGNITIANVAGVQLYLAGNATGGNRTLTSYGMATLLKVQVNTWFINGTGVV